LYNQELRRSHPLQDENSVDETTMQPLKDTFSIDGKSCKIACHELRLKQEEELKEYIGKEIDLYIYKSNDELTFLADNKYPVTFLYTQQRARTFSDGDVMHGIVSSVNLNHKRNNNIRLVLSNQKLRHSHPLQDENSVDETIMQPLKDTSSIDREESCTIHSIQENGFTVTVNDQYAFLPFKFTPWLFPIEEYMDVSTMEYWQILFPTLEGKSFLCKVSESEKSDEKINITVDASIHHFKPFEPERGIKYTGIIIKKRPGKLLIETVCNFDW
jgi:hypothetical protein